LIVGESLLFGIVFYVDRKIYKKGSVAPIKEKTEEEMLKGMI
jgi:hypothetical protein